MNVDFHRAHIGTRSAQAAGKRQTFVLLRFAGRVDDRADRPADRDTITVPAAAAIHGARIEAGAATDAVQRAAEIGASEQLRPFIIDQYDMQLAAGNRPVKVRRVGGDRLAGRGAGQ